MLLRNIFRSLNLIVRARHDTLALLGAIFPLNHRISICPLEHNIYLKFPPASKANPLAAPWPNTTPAAWSSSSPHHLAAVSPAPGGDRQKHSPGCTLAQLHLSGALLQISEGRKRGQDFFMRERRQLSAPGPAQIHKHSPAETKLLFLLPLQKETFSDALEGISRLVLLFLSFSLFFNSLDYGVKAKTEGNIFSNALHIKPRQVGAAE